MGSIPVAGATKTCHGRSFVLYPYKKGQELMTCKNGARHYLLLGVSYSLIIFVADRIFEEHSILTSALIAIVVGILIPIVLLGCDSYDLHCARKIREEEMKTQKIICEGWAQEDEHDGWLFFTESYLKFHPYKAKDKCFEYPINNVKDVSSSFAFLTVTFDGGEVLRLHVNKPYLWKRTMLKYLKNDT